MNSKNGTINDSQHEKVKESNAKLILLSKFVNRNTIRNIKMKRIRFNESTDDVAELRKYLDDFADATIEASKKTLMT